MLKGRGAPFGWLHSHMSHHNGGVEGVAMAGHGSPWP